MIFQKIHTFLILYFTIVSSKKILKYFQKLMKIKTNTKKIIYTLDLYFIWHSIGKNQKHYSLIIYI